MFTEKVVLSVGELTRRLKRVLEEGFRNVAVQGEISNCKLHTSGHLYFTLKDEASQIQCVMWRSRVAGLFFTPEDGMKVVVRGNVTVYEPRGAYQIDVAQLQPTGVGELQAAFERLKQRLLAEGLFDPAHKKRIPPFPHAIGLVTSPTGAAIRDLVTVIRRRFPPVDLILYPVRVQGSGAAEEIAGAIRDFNEYGRIEVMIVGRGGGSLEDLWAFNEEVVARAIYDSRIPVISAVGHEVDFTIADFVADLRAPTPSAAGEMVVHDYREIVENVRNFLYNIEQSLMAMIRTQIDEVHSVVRSYAFNRPLDLLHRFAQALDEADRGLARAIGRRTESERERIRSLGERLRALDPQAVLGRGYAIVTRESTAIGSAAELRSKDDISVRFHDGSVPAVVR